jgi:hypothetical protein
MPYDSNKLIPELPHWNNGQGISVRNWLRCIGNYEYAIAYAELFWPDFVEHDGCILRDPVDSSNYRA